MVSSIRSDPQSPLVPASLNEFQGWASDFVDALNVYWEMRGVADDVPIDSSDVTPRHWLRIASLMLIAMQRPNATHVAGFRAWLGLGRHVRKGEKGIAILAPIITKRKRDTEDQQQDDSSSTAEAVGHLVGFRSAYVFDIAQTDGQDLPEFATVKGEPKQYLERLKVLVASHAIAVDYDESIAPAKGVSRGGRITLLPNQPGAGRGTRKSHTLFCRAVLARGCQKKVLTRGRPVRMRRKKRRLAGSGVPKPGT